MPARLTTPIEITRKEAVLVAKYKTVQIVISLEGNPYIRIDYNGLDSDGNVVSKAEALLEGREVADYITNNRTFYSDVKRHSYLIGKSKGVIPNDAGIT